MTGRVLDGDGDSLADGRPQAGDVGAVLFERGACEVHMHAVGLEEMRELLLGRPLLFPHGVLGDGIGPFLGEALGDGEERGALSCHFFSQSGDVGVGVLGHGRT